MSAFLHTDYIRTIGDAGSARSFARLAELAQRYLGCEAAVLSVDDPRTPARRRGQSRVARCGSAAFRRGHERRGVDVLTLANPLVAGEQGMHFYAGLPLWDYQGRSIGMLAAMDPHERTLAPEELNTLRLLAGMASDLYEMQRLSQAA